MRDLNDSFDAHTTLLLAAIESFTVGLVIVAQNGTILHKNRRAQALLEEMPWTSSKRVPETLWHSCQTLMENQDEHSGLFPAGYTIVLEDAISTSHGTIHMRVQWFDWDNNVNQSSDCFLITLENRQQFFYNCAPCALGTIRLFHALSIRSAGPLDWQWQ
ncbi:MAG: hypothetical protein AAFX51_10485 [Cyanobacteria bacterium J06636_28]